MNYKLQFLVDKYEPKKLNNIYDSYMFKNYDEKLLNWRNRVVK